MTIGIRKVRMLTSYENNSISYSSVYSGCELLDAYMKLFNFVYIRIELQ